MTNRGELIVERIFQAPVDLLWEVHNDPEHLVHWWRPTGFQMEVKRMEVKPGGILHYRMDNGGGFEMWGLVKYVTVEKPNCMEYINSFSNTDEEIVRHPMADTWPLRVHNVLTFEEVDDGTRLTMRSWPVEATEIELSTWIQGHDSVRGGLKGALDQLELYLLEVNQ